MNKTIKILISSVIMLTVGLLVFHYFSIMSTSQKVEKISFVGNPSLFLRQFREDNQPKQILKHSCDFGALLLCSQHINSALYPFTALVESDEVTIKGNRLTLLKDSKWNVFWIKNRINTDEYYGPYRSDFKEIVYQDLSTISQGSVEPYHLIDDSNRVDIVIQDKKIIITYLGYTGGNTDNFSSDTKLTDKSLLVTAHESDDGNFTEGKTIKKFKIIVNASSLSSGIYRLFVQRRYCPFGCGKLRDTLIYERSILVP